MGFVYDFVEVFGVGVFAFGVAEADYEFFSGGEEVVMVSGVPFGFGRWEVGSLL